MIGRIAAMAASALLLSGIQVAHAQQSGGPALTPPVSITPQGHWVNVSKNGTLNSTGGSKASSIGWYYVHATHCSPYYDGVNQWMYMYPQEGGDWFTTLPVFQGVMATQCAHGYWVAFYVYNTSGNWSQMWTYDFL
jgi:hypothetical protein